MVFYVDRPPVFWATAKPETPVLDLAPGQVAQSHERDSRFRSQPCRTTKLLR